MKVIESTERNENLIPILIIGHGLFPNGLLSSLMMISGDQRNIDALCFEVGDDPDAFGEEIERVLDSNNNGTLVLVDLMGGTPFNQLCMHLKENTEAVTGVNLAMLVEAASAREYCSLSELVETVTAAGGVAIVDVVRKLRERRKNI